MTRRRTRNATRAAILGATASLILCSCGADESDGPATGDLDGGLGEIDGSDGASPLLFGARQILLTPGIRDNVDRIDPATDGWRSEVLNGLAKNALHEFLHHLLAGEMEAAKALCAGDFRVSVLRPEALETAFDDGTLEVRRATEFSGEAFGVDALGDRTAELLKPLRGAPELHERLKIDDVQEQGTDRFRTEVFITFYGSPNGRSVQLSTRWMVDFLVVGEDEGARLSSIEVVDYEEVVAKRPMFGELTDYVFDFPGYADFERGTGEYRDRVDRIIGNTFWGQQGLAIGDVNGDGREDIYVCQPAGLPNRLLLRNADGTVTDDSARSATAYLENTASALILDMDNDGDQDLVVALSNLAVVVYNDGTGVFREHSVMRGKSEAPILSMSAADADGDGDLDLYVCRHSDRELLYVVPTPYYDAKNGSRNSFFRNEGNRKFTDLTEELGFEENNTRFSYSSIWEDFDDDGDVDLYVANDFGRNNYFRNDGDRFRDVASEAGVLDISAGMGVAVSDYDLDGDMDLYVTNMYSSAGKRVVAQSDQFMGGEHLDEHPTLERYARGNTLYANNGDGTFEDVTVATGVAPGGWGWGARFVEFNNDGHPDVYSPCGFVTGAEPDDL